MKEEINISFTDDLASEMNRVKDRFYPESSTNEMLEDLIKRGLSAVEEKPAQHDRPSG